MIKNNILNPDMKVIKRFKSPDGRLYNTFLVSHLNKKLIVKLGDPDQIKKEKDVIRRLKEINPKIKIPNLVSIDLKEENQICMEYIEGFMVSEELKNNEINKTKIFYGISNVLNQLYSINVKTFNLTINGIETENWFNRTKLKFEERLEVSRNFMSDKNLRKVNEIWEKTKMAVKEDSQKDLTIIHRDLYADNFIIDKEDNIYLIDFGMAIYGRPIYDLGKFIIYDLYYNVEYSSDFFDNLDLIDINEENDKKLLLFYTLNELLGMLGFFNRIRNEIKLKSSILKLDELVEGKGIFSLLY